MIHIMRLDEPYFDLIINNKKRVEIRLNDTKRKSLLVGDTIKFLNKNDQNRSIITMIDELKTYTSFKEMFLNTPSNTLGWGDLHINDMLKKMYKIYTIDAEKYFGVIKITFHII
ncbi:ASCH domain-containing protein [Clostridium novyi]